MSDKDEFVKGDLAWRLEDAAVPTDPTRRSFIQAGAGIVVGVAALAGAGHNARRLPVLANRPAARSTPRDYEPSYADIVLRVNGDARSLRIQHQRTLLLALREDLGLTGTKKSCNLGQCGACTVLIDDQPVYSCLLLALDATGRDITTIEGISDGGKLHPIQEGFVRHMGSQCGHCTPGMIMSGVALLRQNPRPTLDDVRRALSGNLCRCGNYRNEIDGVLYAAGCEPSGATGFGTTNQPAACGQSASTSSAVSCSRSRSPPGSSR